MRIITRNTNRSHFGGYTLFIFEFLSRDEFEAYLDSLRYCADQLLENRTHEMMLDTVDKLKQRCDDRYAHDDTVLSASLFPDEMARFVMAMTGVAWMYEDFNRFLDGVFAEIDGQALPSKNVK